MSTESPEPVREIPREGLTLSRAGVQPSAVLTSDLPRDGSAVVFGSSAGSVIPHVGTC
jgi:hypothetical protein